MCALLPEAQSATKRIDKGLILKALGEQASLAQWQTATDSTSMRTGTLGHARLLSTEAHADSVMMVAVEREGTTRVMPCGTAHTKTCKTPMPLPQPCQISFIAWTTLVFSCGNQTDPLRTGPCP